MKIKPATIILTSLVFFILLGQIYCLARVPSVIDFLLSLAQMSLGEFAFNFVSGLTFKSPFDSNRQIPFFAIAGFTVLITFYVLLIKKNLRNEPRRPGVPDLIQICLVIVMIMTSVRTAALLLLATDSISSYGTMTPDERLIKDYQASYQFSRMLSGHGRVRVISGYEGIKDLQFRMQLAYFLYPLDVRGIHPGPTQACIIVNKENARHYVPEDFYVVKQWDDRTLIAFRKSESP